MNFIKKYKFYILSFIIPMIILIIVFLSKGIFTDKTVLSSDLASQHLPLFSYFYNVLHGKASFPYYFSKSLGGTMFGAFFFALSSPLNLLVFFFDDIQLFLTILIIIKISLCGLTMFIFLKNKFSSSELYTLAFSLAYALMSYNINYYNNLMWLDSVFLAPLVLLGIEKILAKKGHILYILTLFMCIISNYYTGYMVVIFSIIYYLYCSYTNYKGKKWLQDNLKNISQFFLITLLIGLMTMFILLPLALEAINYIRVDAKFKLFNLNYLDLFAGGFIGFGNLINPVNYYGFLIYCGIVMFPLVINYLFSKNINIRERKAAILVYAILLLPILITPLNAVWHLFTFPQGFNYRYSFLATLFTLIIAFKSFSHLSLNLKKFKLLYILFVFISFSLLYTSLKTPEYYIYLNPLKIIITLILLLVYIILLSKNKKKIIISLLIIELIVNLGWISYESNLEDSKNYYLIKSESSYLNQYYANNHRCEFILNNNLNESFIGNYNGITVFLSSLNKKIVLFLFKINGIDIGTANFFKYNFSDHVSNMLLGVDYIGEKYNIKGYKLEDKFNEKYILRNENALSLGYTVSSKIKNFKSNKMGYEYLSELLNVMDDKKRNYFIELPLEKINANEYIVKKDKQYPYLYIVSNKPIINNKDNFIYSADKYGVIYDKDNKDIILKFKENVKKIKVYTIDVNKLKQFKNNREELEIDVNKGNYLSGTINVNKDATLFTTIPYEKGWTILVDGKKVKHYEVLDTFIALDLKKGEHKVEFYYYIPGFKLGLSISLFSLIILIVYEIRKKKVI